MPPMKTNVMASGMTGYGRGGQEGGEAAEQQNSIHHKQRLQMACGDGVFYPSNSELRIYLRQTRGDWKWFW